jgi:hypothetical protein
MTKEPPRTEDGIDIPELLQPLFGIDFVPFIETEQGGLKDFGFPKPLGITSYQKTEKNLHSVKNETTGDDIQIEALLMSVNEKKKIKPGLLRRVKGRLRKSKSPRIANIIPAATHETKTEDDFKGVPLYRSESDLADSDTNSILADSSLQTPPVDTSEYDALCNSLRTKQTMMKAGVIQSSQRYLYDDSIEDEDEKDVKFDALVKSVNNKKEIEAGLLKRGNGRRKKKQSKSPRATKKIVVVPSPRREKVTDDDMKALDLVTSGSDLEIKSILWDSTSSLQVDTQRDEEAIENTKALVLKSSRRQLSSSAENTLESGENPIDVDVDALDQSLNDKEKIKAGLLKRLRRRKNSVPTPRKGFNEMKSRRQRILSWGVSGASSEASRQKSEGSDSMTTQNTIKWVKIQHDALQSHQIGLHGVQQQIQVIQDRGMEIHKRVNSVQDEIMLLQKALKKAQQQLHVDLTNLEATQVELARLEKVALTASEAVLVSIHQIQAGLSPEDNCAPLIPSTSSIDLVDRKPLTQSDTFMRVHDLEIERSSSLNNISSDGSASVSSAAISSIDRVATSNFIFVDHYVTAILENLSKLGYRYVTDESKRFVPTRDTERILSGYKHNGINGGPKDWIDPWSVVHGTDILIWMGSSDHNGYGSKGPVCKARGLIKTSPRKLVEFILDSTRIKEYNKMSQGRDDLVIFQDDLDITAEDSPAGFAGVCKIVRSRNKPKLLPKTIEITSLLHARAVENAPGTYLIVNRSVFDNDSGALKNTKDTIVSEMLLGVNLIRPIDDTHQVSEFSSVTHIYSPNVPEMLTKRVAPSGAHNMIKDIQKVFN